MIVRCAFCPTFMHETDTETALKLQQTHRQTVHPNVKITHRKRYRRGAMQISDKTVATNIEAVRKEGGAAWVNRVA
jgi:hypothetical protein